MTGALEGLAVTVVVLGDVGRSPRMLYHALALADAGAEVDLVGYAGTRPHARIERHPRIRSIPLPALELPAWARSRRALFLTLSAARFAAVAGALGWALLLRARRPHVLLTQNPPAIPTLPVTAMAARIRGARWIIDWHNFGYSILALRLGPTHRLVRAMAWAERHAGRMAHAHLCVSEAMARELETGWQMGRVTVLHDRPAWTFRPMPTVERRRAVAALASPSGQPAPDADPPLLLVSPTSWTPDEDFGLLLEALDTLEARWAARAPGSVPRRVLVLITGDGRGRAAFERRLATRSARRIEVRTAWLAAEDYPRALAAADLGLCLHRSSSGLDIPMKVADMLGAGVPVCAYDYGPPLAEIVEPGTTAVLFRSAAELADRLDALLSPPGAALAAMRAAVATDRRPAWSAHWMAVAAPLFVAPRSRGAV